MNFTVGKSASLINPKYSADGEGIYKGLSILSGGLLKLESYFQIGSVQQVLEFNVFGYTCPYNFVSSTE